MIDTQLLPFLLWSISFLTGFLISLNISSFRITELDCGQLSSGSESDDSSDEVDIDVEQLEQATSIFATPSHEDESPEEGEVENDVDDETMSGKK